MPDSKRARETSLTPRLEQKLILTKTEKFYLNILSTPFHLLKEKYLPVMEVEEYVVAYSEDLHQVLVGLLPFLGLSDNDEKIAEYIIYNIDSRGKVRIAAEEIAENFGIDISHAQELIELLLTEFSEEISQNTGGQFNEYIEPDVIITPEKVEVLRIEVKDPIIMKALEMRAETLYKICEEIRKVNEYFLRGYRRYPQILTMRHLSKTIDLHTSTISRAVKGKYASTPVGTLPLRLFFGKIINPQIIKSEIKRLLEIDNTLTDAHLALILKSEGINISRRTVNKYRKQVSTATKEGKA